MSEDQVEFTWGQHGTQKGPLQGGNTSHKGGVYENRHHWTKVNEINAWAPYAMFTATLWTGNMHTERMNNSGLGLSINPFCRYKLGFKIF